MGGLFSEFIGNPPAKEESILGFEQASGLSLPLEYKEFLQLFDGGEGFIGSGGYLVLWPVEDLIQYNREYEVAEYCPRLLLIGSSGGGEAFGLDFNDLQVPVVEVPFVGMDPSLVRIVHSSFSGFLRAISQRRS